MEVISCYGIIWTIKKKILASRCPDWKLFLYFLAGLDAWYECPEEQGFYILFVISATETDL